MSAGTLNFFNSFTSRLGADISLSGDSIKMLLCTSAYTPSPTHETLSDVTNEVSGNGYARQSLTGQSYTQVGGLATFDCDDIVFQATGGNWTARHWILFDDSLVDKPLICYGLIDGTGVDVPITDGNTLTISPSASGLFTQEFING